MTRVWLIEARKKNGAIIVLGEAGDQDTPTAYCDKQEALDILRGFENIPSDVVEISVVEYVENKTIETRKVRR